MASLGSENVKSKRISNEGDVEGGSGDYRYQFRRGNQEEVGEEEEFDEAENEDQVDEQALSTHPSVLFERTPTNFNKGGGQPVINFHRILSNRESQLMIDDMGMDQEGFNEGDQLFESIRDIGETLKQEQQTRTDELRDQLQMLNQMLNETADHTNGIDSSILRVYELSKTQQQKIDLQTVEFAKLESDFISTKQQNAELMQEIGALNDQIVKKTSEYENLIEEIEEMSRTVDNYERDVKLRLESERGEWQLKYRKMETERMRLVCEVEERHQVIRNNEKERD